jgi:protein O-GlcNAc transferase
LANSRFNSEVFGDTLSLYDRLFAIKRSLPTAAWVQRGMSHQRMGDLATAQEHFRIAAAMMPDNVRIQLNLGTVHSELKQFGDAEAAWMRALDLDPHNGHALSMLAHDRQHRCAWHGLERLFAEINALLESPGRASEFNVSPFALLAMPSSPLAQLRAAQRYAAQIGAAPSAVPAVPMYAGGERLRVGFVSSDFRDHPMAHLSMEYWERLDRDRIETFAYGIRAADHGPTGQRIERAFEHFVDVSNASTADIVRRIRDDRIGVLFDLNGYTTHSRERIFVQRPAPIQVNCIGFPGTLGAAWYDYIYTDAVSLTAAMEPFFSERPLCMPHMAFPSDTRRSSSGVTVSRVECGLPQDAFVFCCFNNAYKILPEVFAVWMRLLAAIDHAVLWLLDTSTDAKENLQREAALAGIDPRRLIFAPKVPVERHLARHSAADLFLDTLPYGAHTTANDALLASLPVLTCMGDTLVSRIAASQLFAIDLGELVTTDLSAYEAAALDLVRNPVCLASLRAQLIASRDTAPLFDMARYARDFASVVTSVWQDYVARATQS